MISIIATYLIVAISMLGPLDFQEGPLQQNFAGYILADLEFTGSILFDSEKLKIALPIRSGEPFDPKLIKEGLEQIQQLFFGFGYIDFTYIPQIDINHSKKTVTCSILLLQGRQYFVRKIDVYGLGSDEDGKDIKSTLRTAGLEERWLFSPKQLDKAIQSLNELLDAKNLTLTEYGFKRSSDEAGTVDVNIGLQPKDR